MRQSGRVEKNNYKLAILSGALLALLVSSTLFTPLFKVRLVTVNLNPFTTEEELLGTAEIVKGKTILTFLSEGQVIKRLKTHPYVADVNMAKIWPQKIDLKITYRQDSFAIPNAGFYIILDDQLQVLRVDKMAYDATVLEGITFKEFKIGKKINVDQAKVLERTVTLKQLMLKSHITFLSKVQLNNDSLTVYTKQGLMGSFGDGRNIEERFNSFVDIYDNLESKGIKSGLIDVSSDGLPTYKPFGK